MVPLKSFGLLLNVLAVCSAMEHSCKWLMDVLEMLPELPEKEFRVYYNTVQPGRSFFLRIRISCQSQVNPFLVRSLVYSGYTPLIKLELINYGLEGVMNARKILYSEGALVQFSQSSNEVELQGNFLMLNNSNFDANPATDHNCTPQQSNKEEIISERTEENLFCPNSSSSRLSDVAWLVPLPPEDSTVLIKCSVTNPNAIEEKSYSIHSSGVSEPNENYTFGEYMKNLPDGYKVDQTFIINHVVMAVPFWLVAAIGKSDYCLLTNSDFEKTTIVKVHNISEAGHSKICAGSCSLFEIKETLSLPDRILLSTCFGLKEIRATPHNYLSKLILPLCIRKMVAPPQSFPGTIKILAIEESSARLFESDVSQETSLYFTELNDFENYTLCEFLASELNEKAYSTCIIQDGSINSFPWNHYVFLVYWGYLSKFFFYTVGYTDKKWKILVKFPSSLQKGNQGDDEHGEHWTLVKSSSTGSIPIDLTGLSFTRSTGNELFAWGSVLLYSPNGGEDFLWLWDFPNDSNITVFVSADDGSYAFLTTSQKVWWGHAGFASVHLLETAEQWNIGLMTNGELPLCLGNYNILSLLFDASGQLWKVIQCQNRSSSEPCIFRAKVAISDLLSHAQLTHQQTANDDDAVTSPSVLENEHGENRPNHCLKFVVDFSAPHSNYYSRHIIDDIEIPHLINTIPVSFTFLENYLENGRTSIRGEDTVELFEIQDVLPARIYLKKGDFYTFDVAMSLDSDPLTDSSVYWSSLDQLRLSYKGSDFGSLNVTVVRKVFSHKGTVQYQDSGLLQKKNSPGIGLHPVEFRVQPWQADETCFVKKTERGVLRGTQSMTVLLGCPPGIKIMFDPVASVNASKKNQFCDAKHGIACFLYEYAFHPVFNMLDEATGNITLFVGKYRLTIVGGGEELASVVDYSQGDRALYNYKKRGSTSGLIWTPENKNLGSIPSFNISTNGLQWLCGRKSPCSEISPVFPHSPEFYFKLEFTNRGIEDDNSNCDLTSQFIIRIHGLPLGSLYPATVIVVTCIGIITSYVLTQYAFKRKDRRLWNLSCDFVKSKRAIFENWMRKTFRWNNSRVLPSAETSAIEDCDTQV